MPKLKTDLPSRLLVQSVVDEIASATVDGGRVASELCVTLARISGSQLMNPLQSQLLKQFTGWPHRLLLELGVAFILGQQIAAVG